MNILREVRKINKKSIIVKIKIIALLCILLISSIYAWIITTKNIGINNLEGRVDSWDAIYVYDDQIKENEVTIDIDNFYPGENYTKIINIYNTGLNSSYVQVELIDVKIFGESKINYIKNLSNSAISTIDDGEIEYSGNGNINNNVINLFGNNDYPFELGYILNKNYISEKFDVENPTLTPDAQATLTLNFNWDYDKNDSLQDELDTQIGSQAFEYYNTIKDEDNVQELKSKALEIKLKIKSSKYTE